MSASIEAVGEFYDRTGNFVERIGEVTGTNDYAAGGFSAPPEAIGLGHLDLVLFEPASNGTVILFWLYDYANEKIKSFDMAGAETADDVDLSTYTARFRAWGH